MFCARNSVLVKKSKKIFQNKCGRVVLYELYSHTPILWYWFQIFFFSEHFQPDLSQPSKEALLVYHDDSSDELNDKLDEMLLPASDTDNDDWDNQNEAAEAESSDEAEDVVEVEDDSDDNAGADQDESDQDGGPRVNGVNPDEGHESSDMDADD